jgi:hypothetical protein
MDGNPRWVRALWRGIGGTVAGLLAGSIGAGFFATVLGCVAEMVSPETYAGLGTEAKMVFLGAAGLGSPGGAIAGAVGAIWRRPLLGALVGVGVMLGPALYFSIWIWLDNDPEDRLFTCLFCAGSTLVGPLVAGLAGVLGRQIGT